MSDCDCDCHMMQIGGGFPDDMPEHCKSCCEHEDFESNVKLLDKELYDGDRLIILDLKCEECEETGIAVEMHYGVDEEDGYIEAEHLWGVTYNGKKTVHN